MVRNRLCVLKHRFINWLVVLQTTKKMAYIGVSSTYLCLMCARNVETHTHLFLHCAYSGKCLEAIKSWLQITTTRNTLGTTIRRIPCCKNSKFVKQVKYAGVLLQFTLYGNQGILAIGITMSLVQSILLSRFKILLN